MERRRVVAFIVHLLHIFASWQQDQRIVQNNVLF